MIWIIFIGLEIARNYWLIEKKKTRPIYLQSFVIRGMAAIFHGIIVGVATWQDYLPVFIFQITSFWLLFDIGLNLARKKPLIYKGETSGYLDSLHPILYWVLKLVSLAGLIFALYNY